MDHFSATPLFQRLSLTHGNLDRPAVPDRFTLFILECVSNSESQWCEQSDFNPPLILHAAFTVALRYQMSDLPQIREVAETKRGNRDVTDNPLPPGLNQVFLYVWLWTRSAAGQMKPVLCWWEAGEGKGGVSWRRRRLGKLSCTEQKTREILKSERGAPEGVMVM